MIRKHFKSVMLVSILVGCSSTSERAELDNRFKVFAHGATLNPTDEALIKEAGELVELDPEGAYGAYAQGYIANARNERKNAIKHYSKAIAIDGKFAYAYMARGHAYSAEQQFQAALDDFEAVKSLSPDMLDLPARLEMAMGYSRVQKFAEATEILKPLISEKKNLEPAHYYIVLANYVLADIRGRLMVIDNTKDKKAKAQLRARNSIYGVCSEILELVENKAQIDEATLNNEYKTILQGYQIVMACPNVEALIKRKK